MESRFEAESSTFFLKVEETPELWPEESARARTPVTCHDHVEPMQWRHLNVFNKGDGAGGEGIEVFNVDHGVNPAAQFHQILVGLQNQKGPVERQGDAHGCVEGVARVT